MSTPDQRIAAHAQVASAIAQAAHGDAMAERYLWIVAQAARVLDDLIDADHPVEPQRIIDVFHALLVEVNRNPFFVRNRDFLTGLQLMALNAWLDANAWARDPDPTRRLYAHVLRDLISELLPAVAYLTGGWSHCRNLSLPIRETFKKEPHPHGNV